MVRNAFEEKSSGDNGNIPSPFMPARFFFVSITDTDIGDNK
jgi:hypothetical protein